MADQQTLAPYSEREITLTRVLDAPRSRVWAAWTEPEHLTKWFAPAGFTCPEASVDLRVGGEARLVMRSPDGVDMPNVGHFEEVAVLVDLDELAGYLLAGLGEDGGVEFLDPL